ncbi:probable serine carboxypeptidase CPVL [Oppia nitens]|uniref:probable serine carboxypeptidase CPVL n=1 Tax=Oppia nitens TaxID=1686743 RepID=UPI0023DBE1BA|nr:probable serine carboxypeptidase CPVL [Oppia nitens]
MSMFMWGPLVISDKLNVTINSYSLSQEFSIIYVDNPVGTGFSYTNDSNGYCKDQQTIAQNLYEFIQQFYIVFDDYRSNDLYIGGQSYAGKYVPSFGHYLIQMSHISKLNFKGILVGNGWTDPINQISYDKTLLSLGLIDENEAKEVKQLQQNIKNCTKSKDYRKAFEWEEQLLTSIEKPSYLTNTTGYQQFYDIHQSEDIKGFINVDQYLTQKSVRNAIHVGDVVYNLSSSVVMKYMEEDIYKTAEPNLTAIIDSGSKVLLFTGNFDIIVGIESTNGLLFNKNWKYYNDYNKAKRNIWRVNANDTQIAGYEKSFDNFSHVIVRNAGHCSMLDQPRATLDMANRFIKSIPFGQ